MRQRRPGFVIRVGKPPGYQLAPRIGIDGPLSHRWRLSKVMPDELAKRSNSVTEALGISRRGTDRTVRVIHADIGNRHGHTQLGGKSLRDDLRFHAAGLDTIQPALHRRVITRHPHTACVGDVLHPARESLVRAP